MCSWNFSKLFKEGSWVLRGKVCLWVMFLLLPRAIFRILQIGENKTKKARLRLTSLFYFFFWLSIPYVTRSFAIHFSGTLYYCLSFLQFASSTAKQPAVILQICRCFSLGCVEPHILLCCCSPLRIEQGLFSYELWTDFVEHQWTGQCPAVPALCIPTPV